MKRQIITTGDGSTTIQIPEWDEQYHSKHGAIQEARHVFIKQGLHYILSRNEDHINAPDTISILEVGFGTGLNALITFLEAEDLNVSVDYVGVEGYPVEMDEIKQLNYTEQMDMPEVQVLFEKMHALPWEAHHKLAHNFKLTKQHKMFDAIDDVNTYDLVYFDAFGARVQPELWTESIFQKMYNALADNGVLVTYSAKGSVRRAMQTVGFNVEKLPGPPGKREMLRATK